MRSPNDDLVLQSFYEERQSRSKVPKRHSLLQKNMSYFSNTHSTHQDENICLQPSKQYSDRKKKME